MKKILVCDDDAGIQEVMKIILEENGYQVKGLSNGKSIQKIVIEYKPDLIFLDLWMPGMDGKEIVKILKRDPSLCRIPICIVSALNDLDKIVKELGAEGYISKPFDIDQLLSLIKDVLAANSS